MTWTKGSISGKDWRSAMAATAGRFIHVAARQAFQVPKEGELPARQNGSAGPTPSSG